MEARQRLRQERVQTMKKEILIFCAIAAWLAGCSSSGQKQSTEKYQGREETKKLEGASAV